MYTEKYIFIKNGLNRDFLELEGQSMQWKHTDIPVKKIFQAQQSPKNKSCDI